MHRRSAVLLVTVCLAGIAGCHAAEDDDAASPGAAVDAAGTVSNVVVTHPALPPLPGQKDCTIETGDFAPTSAAHVATCTPISYPTEPPCGGPHYPYWAQFGTYHAPLSEGFLVHDLEHGAVWLASNCPDGCAAVDDAFAAIVAALPDDALCTGGPRVRAVIAPDPRMTTPIGAAAWGHYYKATCLDRAGLAAWAAAHYGQGPEATCASGVDFSLADGGVNDPCAGDAGADAAIDADAMDARDDGD